MVSSEEIENLYDLLHQSLSYTATRYGDYITEVNQYLLDVVSAHIENRFIDWNRKRNNIYCFEDLKPVWGIILFYFLFETGKEFPETFKLLSNKVKDILENSLEKYLTHREENLREIVKVLLSTSKEGRIEVLARMVKYNLDFDKKEN